HALAEVLTADVVQVIISSVFEERWKAAESEVIAPETSRVPSSPESIDRGRRLFLNLTGEQQFKLDCIDCHGPQAQGNGSSFVDPEIFNQYVFGNGPREERVLALKQVAGKVQKKWADDWGNPLRPANLNLGVYK